MGDKRLTFIVQQATVSAGTWAAIGQYKLEHMKLDTGPFEIQGVLPPAAFYRESGQDSAAMFDTRDIPIPGVECEPSAARGLCLPVTCSVHALNNVEDTADGPLCNEYLSQAGDKLRECIVSGSAFRDMQRLFSGLLVMHANLKSYVYTYAFAFPYLKLSQPMQVMSCKPATTALPQNAVSVVAASITGGTPVLLQNLRASADEATGGDGTQSSKVLPWSVLSGASAWPEGVTVIALDTSSHRGVLGWPLRNVCALLATHFPQEEVEVLAVRMERGAMSAGQSLLMKIKLPFAANAENAAVGGWHKTVLDKEGRRVPQMLQVPLAATLDHEVRAHEAMKLNLQLMTWRAAPDINLPAISRLHCLVLGCGTLGCEVARTLVAWGVQKITLVDNGKVAYSNPARQSLFTVEDCKEGGVLKAEAAAAALMRIAPKLDAQPVVMSIPMPGHPPVASELDQTQQAVMQLHALIESADAVFLLTDSRESRWLPTLQAAASRTLLINAALAFDSWLTMRHGLRAAPEASAAEASVACGGAQSGASSACGAERLGCYFCNDVVAPANSLARRSMDQQCTVVRPGLARVAAAHAVEMLAALSQHTEFGRAPVGDARSGGVLGGVPHMLRGTFMGFEQTHMHGVATGACSACGDGVLAAYADEGTEFVMKVLQDQQYVEVVSGLQALRMHGSKSPTGDAAAAQDMASGDGDGSGEDDWLAL